MKLPGIRLVPVELPVRWQAPTEGAQAFQQLLQSGLAGSGERTRIGDVDFYLVAFLQFERLDHGGGKPNGEAAAPFGNLQGTYQGYTNNSQRADGSG